jgi:poly-beta-1,6-N-acetyl-D-glucosamine N-deacetylase
MIRALYLAICCLIGTALPAQADSLKTLPPLTIICWHDIRDNLLENFAADPDMTAIDSRDLIGQFELLRGLGYTPIRLQDWLDARAGLVSLPAKPVLLTFDDGYASLHDKVLPLLKLFNYPAVAAIVSDWIVPDDAIPGKFMNQSQLRAIQASGVIELASHSHDLHHGIQANPQGNSQPAANVRAWSNGQYETDAQYQQRVAVDLALSARRLHELTGVTPRAVVWPYGAYNSHAVAAAGSQGYSVSMGLESGLNDEHVSPMRLRRVLVETSMGLTDFARALAPSSERGLAAAPASLRRPSVAAQELGTVRALRISLDALLAAPFLTQEQGLSALLDQVRAAGVNVVFVNAQSENGDTYFPSSAGLLRADLLNRVSWQLRTRADVKVFAVLSLDRAQCAKPDCAIQLASDLGRHVPLAGLVLEGAMRMKAEQLNAIYDAARQYHPELMTAREMQSNQSAEIATLLNSVDFILLNGHDKPVLDPSIVPADRIITQLALIRGKAPELATLYYQGVRHLALTQYDAGQFAALSPEIRLLMSTATRHNPRN